MKHARKRLMAVGWYGAGNVGDELLLSLLVRWAREAGADVVAASIDPAGTRVLHGIDAVDAWNLPELVRALRSCDLCVLGGGGLLHTHYELDFPSLFRSVQGDIAGYVRPLLAARQLGVPILLWAQGVGPLDGDDARRIVADVFASAEKIGVRDKGSEKLLKDIGVARDMVVAPDPVWAFVLPEVETVPGRIGIVVRRWDEADWTDAFIEALSAAVNPVQHTLVWIPFQSHAVAGRSYSDMEFVGDLMRRMPDTFRQECIDERDPQRAVAVLASCECVIAMRLHAHILASLRGIPTLAVEYDEKVAASSRLAKTPDSLRVTPSADAGAWRGAVQALLSAKEGTSRPASSALATAALLHREQLHDAIAVAGRQPRASDSNFNWLDTWRLVDAQEVAQAAARAEFWQRAHTFELALRADEGERWRTWLEAANAARVQAEIAKGIADVRRAESEAARLAADGARAESDAARLAADSARAEANAAREVALRDVEKARLEIADAEFMRTSALEDLARVQRELLEVEASRNAASQAARAATEVLDRIRTELAEVAAARSNVEVALLESQARTASVEYERDHERGLREERERHLALVLGSRSWRVTRPLRGLIALLSKAGRQRVRQRLRRNKVSKLASPPAMPGTVAPGWIEIANAAERVAIVPSAFEFDELANQRPINLAKHLALRGYTVLFAAWQWHREEVLVRSGTQVHPGVWQLDLYDLYDHAATLNPRASGDGLYFITLPAPELVSLHETLRARGFSVVYDVLDDWEAFSAVGQAPWFDAASERLAVLSADAVAAVSPPLAAKFSSLRTDIAVIGNGWSPATLGPDHRHCASTARAPGIQMRVGYFGHLTDAWFDWQMVIAAAHQMPQAAFEIIGYGEPEWVRDAARKLPNLTLVGKVPPARLWEYAQRWQVAIAPFRPGPLAVAIDPIKVYEYLFLGLPTVCTGIPHLAQLPAVEVVLGVDAFVAACRAQAVAVLDWDAFDAMLEKTTWTARFDALLELVPQGGGLGSLYAA